METHKLIHTGKRGGRLALGPSPRSLARPPCVCRGGAVPGALPFLPPPPCVQGWAGRPSARQCRLFQSIWSILFVSARAACLTGQTTLAARAEGKAPPHLSCGPRDDPTRDPCLCLPPVCVGSGQAVDVLRVRQEVRHGVHAAEARAAHPRQGGGSELPAVRDQGVHQGLHEQTHAAQAPGGEPGPAHASPPRPRPAVPLCCLRRETLPPWLVDPPLQTQES